MRFDRYCHQYRVDDDDIEEGEIPKYADLRRGVDPETNEKFCNFDVDDEDGIVDQYYCLGQQCMFEYCIHRRDEWLEECVENEGRLANANWGDVYNFDTMHGDLESNGGDWANAVCDAYYALESDVEDY